MRQSVVRRKMEKEMVCSEHAAICIMHIKDRNRGRKKK